MSRSSAKGQVEPLAALVVLVAVCAAVSAYAAAVDGAIGDDEERSVASPTLDRVVDALASGGVAEPNRTGQARRTGPAGYRLNVTVAAAGRRWHAGPTPPGTVDAETAARRIGVRLGPARIRPGRVRVEVWT